MRYLEHKRYLKSLRHLERQKYLEPLRYGIPGTQATWDRLVEGASSPTTYHLKGRREGCSLGARHASSDMRIPGTILPGGAELLKTEKLRRTPPTRSSEAAVTVLRYMAMEKMESSLIPRVWSSAMLITVSCKPVSEVALCALA